MIWATWRQHRFQLLAGACALLLLGALLLATGIQLHVRYHDLGLDGCFAGGHAQDCSVPATEFLDEFNSYQYFIPLFLAVPAGVGLFWGAPLLARELESGTYRFAWTQSVSRARWLTTKFLVLGLASIAFGGLFALALGAWSAPLVTAANNRIDPGVFDLLGIVPAAYGFFAFALGVALGVLTRRTLVGMAATLGGFIAARGAVLLWARPHFEPAIVASFPFFAQDQGNGAWLLSEQTVDGAGRFIGDGRSLSFDSLHSLCPNLVDTAAPKGDAALQHCIISSRIHVVATVQPADRFWAFQGIEFAIFMALGCLLLVVATWWVRRRLR